MAKQRPSHRPRRKRRTREHIIADMSANHVERHILSCGFSAEIIRHDYGIDMTVSFYDHRGQPQNGTVYLQLKATDNLRLRDNGNITTYKVDCRDLDYWLREPSPVILVVYDTINDRAYWLYVQAHFESEIARLPSKGQKVFTVMIPTKNVVNQAAIRRFQGYNQDVIEQTGQIQHHD